MAKRKRKTRNPRGGGSVKEYRPGVYQGRLPGRGGKTKGGFRSESDAWAWVRAHVGTPIADGTVGQWLADWLTLQQADTKPGTHRRDREVLDAQILPHLGNVRLRDLSADRIERWLAALHSDGASADQRWRAWATLKKALRRNKSFDRRQLEHVRPPRVRRPEPKYLTREQYRTLVQTAISWSESHPYLEALVRVGVECCCRPNELLALRREDYRDGAISVRQALCRRTGRVTDLKTTGSARTVPLSREARAAAEKWLSVIGNPITASAPLFPAARGSYIHYVVYIERVWGPLARAAGLAGYPPYCLRHTGASILVAKGLSLKDIAYRMGHVNAVMILKCYGHVMPGGQEQLTAVFAELG